MSAIKDSIKRGFKSLGFTVDTRDRLAEQIPANYLRSAYLPPIYRQSVPRLIYFERMFSRIGAIEGDVVECGVSIGTGILNWCLLCELARSERHVFGYDSFSGFPPSAEADRKSDGAFQTERGDYASPPELVMKILEEGGVTPGFRRDHVRLVRGYFETTVPGHARPIALLHLDCDLYDSYKTCLAHLFDLVRPGGIVMFDEYEDSRFPGAKQAVDEFLTRRVEKPRPYSEYGYLKYYVVKA